MAEILKDTTNNTIGTGDGGLQLDPSGTEVVTINNGVVIPDGTKSEPAIRLSDDTNTGIYSPTNDSISFVGNGSDVIQAVGAPSGVNYAKVTSSATTADVALTVDGTDVNSSLAISGKGTGTVKVNGLSLPTADGTNGQVLTTDGAGGLTFQDAGGGAGGSELYPAGTWIKETTATTGTGDVMLGGAVTNFEGFSAYFSGGEIVDYHIVEGANWEIGTGTYIGPAPTARYWRINIQDAYSDPTRVRIAEIEFLNGGSDLATGGTAIGTNWNGSNTPASAFDDNDTTFFEAFYTDRDQDVGYDLGAGNESTLLSYTIKPNSQNSAPDDFTLEYSNDGTNWTVVDTRTGEGATWSGLEKRTYTIPANSVSRTTIVNSSNAGSAITLSGSAEISSAVFPKDQNDTMLLNDLSDATITSPSTNEVLTYNGTAWVNQAAGGGEDYVNINSTGTLPVATGTDAISIGESAQSTSFASIAVGLFAQSGGDYSVAIGSGFSSSFRCYATGRSVAIGYSAEALSSTGAVAIGRESKATGDRAVCVGTIAKQSGTDAVAIGYLAGSTTAYNSAVAIGPSVPSSAASQLRVGTSATEYIQYESSKLELTGSNAQYVLPNYTVATVPSGAEAGSMIYVTDGNAGSACAAIYDGTNWKVISLGATISAT